MNYFEFYPGDYLRDTTRLTLVEHGAYLRLLIAYYSEEHPLPADLSELHVITCAVTAADKAAVKKVAERFFPIAADGLRHKSRVDEEIAKAQKRIATARENGSKGGRKSNPSGNPTGNPAGSSTETQRVTHRGTQPSTHSGEALHTPHANNSVGRGTTSSRTEEGDDDGAAVPGEQDLPTWVPRRLWREFYRHRAVCRKPLSIPSQRQVVQRLAELREQGHDIATSLTQTIAAGLAIPVIPRAPDQATETGPPGQAPRPMSKTLQALHELEAVKNGTGLDRSRDQLRIAEADPAQP